MLENMKSMYKTSIKADPVCYKALECLVDNYMLTCEEESTLLKSLHFGKEDEWLAKFYSCLIKKYDKETSVEDTFSELERDTCSFSFSDSSFSQTLKNSDLLACKAEYYHQCGEYQKCFETTSTLLARDPCHLKCILVHLAATVELGNSNDLYLMSSNLVKDYSHKALAWFAVGCYYYCTNKYDHARRYSCKATSVDGTTPLDGSVLVILMLLTKRVIKQCLHIVRQLVYFLGELRRCNCILSQDFMVETER